MDSSSSDCSGYSTGGLDYDSEAVQRYQLERSFIKVLENEDIIFTKAKSILDTGKTL